MGLWDALAAGLGTGLDQGAKNYVDGLQRNQQMDLQRQELAMRQQTAQQQATVFGQQQAERRLGVLQEQGTQAAETGNWGRLAALVPDVTSNLNDAYGLHQVGPKLVGTYGQMPRPGVMGPFDASIPGAAQPMVNNPAQYDANTPDLANPTNQRGLVAALNLKPQMIHMTPGETMGELDPVTHQLVHGYTAPDLKGSALSEYRIKSLEESTRYHDLLDATRRNGQGITLNLGQQGIDVRREGQAAITTLDYGTDGTATVVEARPGTVVHTKPSTTRNVDPALEEKRIWGAVLANPDFAPSDIEKVTRKPDPAMKAARIAEFNRIKAMQPGQGGGSAFDRLDQAIQADQARRGAQ